MSWLSDFLSRERRIESLLGVQEELRDEIERLHGELRETNECFDIVNANLLLVSRILHETVEGNEDGEIVPWIDGGEAGEDD